MFSNLVLSSRIVVARPSRDMGIDLGLSESLRLHMGIGREYGLDGLGGKDERDEI